MVELEVGQRVLVFSNERGPDAPFHVTIKRVPSRASRNPMCTVQVRAARTARETLHSPVFMRSTPHAQEDDGTEHEFKKGCKYACYV